jgi:predicted transcriptional regulator
MMVGEVLMNALKAEAWRMIDQLPEDADWSTLAYRFYLRAAIQCGMADIEAGRVVPHEQVMREMDEWLESFGQRMPDDVSSDT